MLGLLVPTSPQWIHVACSDLDRVMHDHFHCELKAATNATTLVARFPYHPRLVRELSALAREELEHVEQVHAQLIARGVAPRPPEPDAYAAALRKASQKAPFQNTSDHLMDRLLVAALIEARSCERFSLLRDHVPDPVLQRWYADLFASEARHFSLFSGLASEIFGESVARDRLRVLAEHEAEIVASLPLLPRIH